MIDPAIRKLGIGGSEVGAIFGVDGERDAFSIWAEKKGGLPPSPPSDRMIIGKILEPAVLGLYTHVTGRKIRYCDETSRHPQRPWMVYTPDAFCLDEKRGVDAKVVSWDQRRRWGITAHDIPERIQLQCWYYMAALDYEVWDVAALLGDGFPRVYTIERDREAERVMLARVEEFYRRFLVGNEQPPIGGSGSAAAWLQQAFPEHKRPDLREAADPEIEMLARYAQLCLERRVINAERDQLANELKLAVGAREGLIWAGGKFTWRKTKDKPETDWQSIAIPLMERHIPDEETRATLIGLHTYIKPGPRRVWFDCDLFHAEEA